MRRFGRRHRKGDSHLASNDAVTALELGERVGTLHTRELDDDVSVALMRGSGWAACGSRAGTNTPIPTEADAIPEEAARLLYSSARLGYWTRVAEYELDADAHAEADFIDFLRPLVVERRYGTQVLDNAAYVSAGWASEEPWDPDPLDVRSALGGVPGVGPKIRCLLGASLVDSLLPSEAYGGPIIPPGTTLDELRRAWLYGFYLRCAIEADEHGSFA